MILKARLQQYKSQHGASWEIIEQDYILSWILAGLSRIDALKDTLVFKGGTCLRKCYFGDYRFSQDIDMSVVSNHEDLKTNLEDHIKAACLLSESLIQDQGEAVYLQSSPYREKKPHPEGQQAFLIQAKFPWHRDFITKAYVEVSFEEKVILPSSRRSILHPYDSSFEFSIQAYDINEIVAEKIRALLQFSKKLHERGWARSRVRDYYDLWRIFENYTEDINKNLLPTLVEEKCTHKDISFKTIDAIFNDKLMQNAQEEWSFWLKDVVVPDLPERTFVLNALKIYLAEIFRTA